MLHLQKGKQKGISLLGLRIGGGRCGEGSLSLTSVFVSFRCVCVLQFSVHA